MPILYDRIGAGYPRFRRPDPRVTQALIGALRLPAGSIVADIGAGTGKYACQLAEAAGFRVLAIEPSAVMRAQAERHALVDTIGGRAESLPLGGGTVQAAVVVLAMNHFSDPDAALREMDRVTGKGRIVTVTIDPREAEPYWFGDYFPEVWARNLRRSEPVAKRAARFEGTLGRSVAVSAVPVPADFEDLFTGSAWCRPEMYLDERFRGVSASFALVDEASVVAGVKRLRADLKSGVFEERYGRLLGRSQLDVGLRVLSVGAFDGVPAQVGSDERHSRLRSG